MKTFFCDRDFQRSHGKAPKGTGVWAFMPDNSGDPTDWMFSPSMTFKDAKKWAKAQRPDVQDFAVGP